MKNFFTYLLIFAMATVLQAKGLDGYLDTGPIIKSPVEYVISNPVTATGALEYQALPLEVNVLTFTILPDGVIYTYSMEKNLENHRYKYLESRTGYKQVNWTYPRAGSTGKYNYLPDKRSPGGMLKIPMTT